VKYLLLEVVGKREYRGHKPGDQFVTKLDPALQRAIERPNVVVIAEVEPELSEGQYGLPEDWPASSSADVTLTERGGKQ
jgi:lipoate-protein ligase B